MEMVLSTDSGAGAVRLCDFMDRRYELIGNTFCDSPSEIPLRRRARSVGACGGGGSCEGNQNDLSSTTICTEWPDTESEDDSELAYGGICLSQNIPFSRHLTDPLPIPTGPTGTMIWIPNNVEQTPPHWPTIPDPLSLVSTAAPVSPHMRSPLEPAVGRQAGELPHTVPTSCLERSLMSTQPLTPVRRPFADAQLVQLLPQPQQTCSDASHCAGSVPTPQRARSTKPCGLQNIENHQSDQVTTVMVRNLPRDLSQTTLLRKLDEDGFKGLYDFCYLPHDFSSGENQGYAFVNFTMPEAAERFHNLWQRNIIFGPGTAVLSITVALLQGFEANRSKWCVRRHRIKNPEFRPFVAER